MTNPETFDRLVTIGVDIQNDFCPGGALGVDQGDHVIAPFNDVAEYARENGGTVILTQDYHPAETAHFAALGGPWPPHCIENTIGAELHSDLDQKPEDTRIYKGTDPVDDGYSGYEGATKDGNTIEAIVEPKEREHVAVIIGGLATDYCVKETVIDACNQADRVNMPANARKLGVFVIEDAIRAVNIKPKDGERAIAEMKLAGAQFITADQVIKLIQVKE